MTGWSDRDLLVLLVLLGVACVGVTAGMHLGLWIDAHLAWTP